MRAIRRSDREISISEADQILVNGEYGTLSTVDAEGQPYGIPLSYAYRNRSIYFHCAITGHKLDNIAVNAKVSFCVVGKTKVLPDKFATEYESVVVFGTATEIFGPERQEALIWLLEKYCPEHITEGRRYIEQKDKATLVYKIVISNLTGKARR